ncbi:spore cortex biosynthesis protein [Clostridium aceticum]|uniref:Spore cortex biosynthesis protein n=1 Tax=Clostridium aceticum TaxID=84022 RepID=A0A0G3W713_9CLOT|nr:spore cortex biosynthesis protein YabQ [Clostridium aceticum]AKL93635.1 spore cortex biosynthesis protein [Clostridium aceticum]
MISISQETYILLATIYGGILIGFIYDLYKIFRRIFHPKKIATLIQDFLFWLIIAIVAFYVLIISNQGALRFYNFLGFLIGAATYTFLLSHIVVKGILLLLRAIKRFLYDLYQIIIYPFHVGLCLIEVPCSYCKRKTKPIYYKTKKYFKLPGRMMERTKKNISTYFKKK